MSTLAGIRDELQKMGIRAQLVDGIDAPGLNVWAQPLDRYPATTVWFHQSRTTGDGFAWGDRFQYGAPAIENDAHIAAMIAETL